MGNTRCGSVGVIAIANAHTQDDATDSLPLRYLSGKLCAAVNANAVIMHSWTLLMHANPLSYETVSTRFFITVEKCVTAKRLYISAPGAPNYHYLHIHMCSIPARAVRPTR